MYAMLVLRGPQGRLVIPTESPSLNKVFTYLLTTYLQNRGIFKILGGGGTNLEHENTAYST